MRAAARFFRFLLNLQGAVFTDWGVDRERNAVVLHVRRRSHALPRCGQCKEVLRGKITEVPRQWRHLNALTRHHESVQLFGIDCPGLGIVGQL